MILHLSVSVFYEYGSSCWGLPNFSFPWPWPITNHLSEFKFSICAMRQQLNYRGISNSIILWHESENINETAYFQNFSWFQFYIFMLIIIIIIATRHIFTLKERSRHARNIIWTYKHCKNKQNWYIMYVKIQLKPLENVSDIRCVFNCF